MKTKIPHWITAALAATLIAGCASPPSVSQTPSGKTKSYPLDLCIVTDNDLDSMGGRVTRTYNGQEIQFCCKPCVKKFDANPTKYLAKLP